MSPANAVEVLERIYACRCLSSSRLASLAAHTLVHAFQDGDTLVRAATPADTWLIVVSGRARLEDRHQEACAWPAVFGPGDGFGERGLIESSHWPGTVRADGPVTAATVSRVAFEAFTAGLEAGERAVFLQRMAWQADFDFLRRMNLFAHLEPADTERLFDRLDRIAVPRGHYLFHENAPADVAYIVRHGRLRLLTTAGHSRRQLAVRRDGDLVGEIELLYGTPRMADAIADTDCEVFALSRTLFEELTPRDHDRDALYQLATDRLLQYQNALSGDDTRGAQGELPSLHAGWVPVPGQRYGASCPFVPADSPIVAGLACLAMVDAALGREGAWQDRVEQLLWDRTPDTLHSLSRKAEQCGYLTHLVTLAPEVRLRASLPAIVEDADGTLAVLFRGAAGSVVAANPQTGVRTLEATRLGPGPGWPSRMLTLSPTSRDPRHGVLRAYAPYLVGIAVVSLVMYAFGIAAPLAGGWIIDRVLVDGDQALLRLLLFGVLVVLVFHVAAGALREYLVAHTCGRITLALQLRFVDHVMRLPAGAAAAFRVGDLAVRFRENDTFVQNAFKAAMFLVVDALALAVHLAVLAALSLPLAGIALVFAASHAAVAALSAAFTQVANDRHLDARRALRSHLIEAVAGMPTIKALVLEQSFVARGAQLMARRKAGEFREAAWTAHLDLGSRTLHAAAVVAILAYGAVLTLGGGATSGRLFAAMGVFGAMLVPLNGLLLSRGAFTRARGAWANLSDVLDLDPEDSDVTTVAPVLSGHVELKHVSFRYPGALENALTDVTLEVLPGQRVALMGRSGSGKTTLFNLLLGLYTPTRGTIALDQVDMACLPKAALRRQLGVVEQHPFLFDGTVRENISRSDPAIPMDDVVAAARAACADGFIETLPSGYETRIGDRGVTLSGGERQRLVVARALAGRPRMLLFDEATSAIDSRMEREIHAHITRSHGTLTTFLIAHRLSTVREADLIVVLDQGRIVETGTHDDLMARRGLYCYLNTRFV